MLNKGRMGEKPMRNKEQAILEAAGVTHAMLHY